MLPDEDTFIPDRTRGLARLSTVHEEFPPPSDVVGCIEHGAVHAQSAEGSRGPHGSPWGTERKYSMRSCVDSLTSLLPCHASLCSVVLRDEQGAFFRLSSVHLVDLLARGHFCLNGWFHPVMKSSFSMVDFVL